MDNFPTELILAFGQWLNGASLFNSLLVCQRWHQILSPLVWTYITKLQWHHPRFSDTLRSPTALALNPNHHTLHSLSRVQHLEWCTNDALSSLPDVYSVDIHNSPLGLADSKTVDRRVLRLRRQLSWSHLASLLEIMSVSLTTLVLHSSQIRMPQAQPFDSSTQAPHPILTALLGLQNLKRVDLFLRVKGRQKEPLRYLFPMLSKVEELVVKGDWYGFSKADFGPAENSTATNDSTVSHHPHPRSYRQGSYPGDSERGVRSWFLDPQRYPIWKSLWSLEVSSAGLVLLTLCTNLRRLSLNVDGTFQTIFFGPSLSSSVRDVVYYSLVDLPELCPRLEVLRLEHLLFRVRLIRLGETFSSLRWLTALRYEVHQMDDFTFLCLPTSSTSPSQGDDLLPLPHLLDLEMTVWIPNTDETCDRWLGEILKTRPKLRTFVIERRKLCPRFFLEGLESRSTCTMKDKEPKQYQEPAWVCKDLEHLSIAWRPGLTLELYEVRSRKALKAEERHQYWQPIFAQLSQLCRLKTLDMSCPDLNTSMAEVINERWFERGHWVRREGGGDGLCWLGRLKELKVLNLVKPRDKYRNMKDVDSEWREREDLVGLIKMFPGLRRMYFGHLQRGSLTEIRRWLKEIGREEIVVEFRQPWMSSWTKRVQMPYKRLAWT